MYLLQNDYLSFAHIFWYFVYYRYLIDFEVGTLSYLPKYYVPWKCNVISKLLSTFMFVLLLTMTCNQHNGIQILYNIYVSVSNKYLIIIYFWVLTNQNYIVPLCIVLFDFLVHMYRGAKLYSILLVYLLYVTALLTQRKLCDFTFFQIRIE